MILDDKRNGVQHLHNALNSSHDLTWMRNIEDAVSELHKPDKHFDLIICGTHLISESMIDFLKKVKAQADTKKISFVCFRAATTDFAEQVDASIEHTVKLLGANAYISVPEENDPERLRQLIEAEISPIVEKRD